MAWWTKHWEDIRPQLKYEVLKAALGAPAITLGYWLIQRARKMPFDWYVALAFVGLFLAYVFVSAKQRKGHLQPGTAIQPVDGPVQVSVKAVADFYRVGSGPFLEELEAHFQRLSVHLRDTKEREQFLVKALACGAVNYLHDVTWYTIFRSQINALNELNSRPMIIDELHKFYDPAEAANQNFYSDYSFDDWIGYMKEQNVIRQDGNIIQITVRGKDFLKYIVLRGFNVGTRSN